MAKISLDQTDRKILKFLVKNARMPFLEIARECGISGAAIHQRIKKLEDTGVILGSRLIVDPRTFGFDVCAFVSLRFQDSQSNFQVVEQLRRIPEIVECHFITGTYNVMIKLYCLDNDHLMDTIFRILKTPGISTTQTYISLSEAFQRQVNLEYFEERK